MEERKIQEHCNYVTAKLEKLHKNIMWNIYVGRSYLDKVAATSREGAIKMGQFGSLASLYSEKILFLDSINSEFINFLYWECQTHAIPKYFYWFWSMKVPNIY